MPLNDADRAWIRQEIQAAHKRQGWGKLTGFIRDWSGTGAAVAVLLVALAKWEAYVEFRTNTTDRLTHIEKILEDLPGNLAKQNMINQAALPLEDFKDRLLDLSSAITIAQQREVRVDPTVINQLQEKLIAATKGGATSTSPRGYWPTTAQFINYRSQISVADFQSLLRRDLPNCTDHDPTPVDFVVNEKNEKTWKRGTARELPENSTLLYENCRFTLDSAEEATKVPYWRNGMSFALSFRHCQIIYGGGQIKLLSPHPKPTLITSKGARSDVYLMVGQSIKFENCLFTFTLPAPPPPEGQDVTQQLLAQSGSTLTVRVTDTSTHS
jgi:hypothetical protein